MNSSVLGFCLFADSVYTKSLKLYPTLCDGVDCSPLGLSVHGILQARIVRLPCPPPGYLPKSGIEPMSLMSPALACGFFTTEPLGKSLLGFCLIY